MMKIFDSHFHIIDTNYLLKANKGYLPPEFLVQDYLDTTKDLNIIGGAIVSGSFQGFDQLYLTAALKLLGEGFVGVTQLPHSTSDEEIIKLNQQGVRAVRFNLFRGGSESLKHLEAFAKRIAEIADWHVELYIDSRKIADIMPILKKLPKLSIDHLGLEKDGFSHVLNLVELGHKVKASGFMSVNFDVVNALKEITLVNPNALMFGTDLPGTRAPRRFDITDLDLLRNNFTEAELKKILYDNAVEFYQPNFGSVA